MKGTVTAFDDGKGIGFILGEDKREYLVEYTEVRSPNASLQVGSQVEFDAVDTSSGPQAAEVRPLDH
jgi:CspA family cold shock protein